MTKQQEELLACARRAVPPVPTYTARCGIVWGGGDVIPMTITQAEKAAADLLELAIPEHDDTYSAEWVCHLPTLVAAIREAKGQAMSRPVEEIAA